METAALILAMAVVTYLTRWAALAVAGRTTLSERASRALTYVPPAVLTAIIVPALLSPGGSLNLSLHNTYLVGGLVATFVAWRTRQLLPTIVLGMAVFWLARLAGL